jgi:hypothetical protein
MLNAICSKLKGITWPVYMPSAQAKSFFSTLYEYGDRNCTTARGAPLPGSWMISLITPLMYPLRSA